MVHRNDVQASAEKILYTYILPGGKRVLALPNGITDTLSKEIEMNGREDPEVFDAAKHYVFQVMEREYFPGFINLGRPLFRIFRKSKNLARSDRIGGAVPATPTQQPLRSRTSRDSFSSCDSRSSFEDDHAARPIKSAEPGILGGIGALGMFGYFKEKRRQTRVKKDDARIEEMRQQEQHNAERINRANSRRYTDRPRAQKTKHD